MVLTTEPSVFYFSGTVASRPPGLIISADPDTAPILVCRDGERDNVAAIADIEVIGAPKERTYGTLSDVLAKIGLKGKSIGFEDAAVTYQHFSALADAVPDVTWHPASSTINRLRLVKEEEEIACLRKAGKVSDLAMMAAINALKAGKNESQAAAAAESTMREHGMFIAYETLIGSGFRSGLLRRYPNLEVPEPDALIKIDLAAKLSFAAGYGYHTDQTRTITTGAPSGAALEILSVTAEVQQATLEALKPGRTIRDAGLAGLAVVKGTKWEELTSMSGHGIGLDVHEWPSFNETVEVILEPGQVYAIEPHIVVPNVHTSCFEDTVLITDDGYERITQLPHELWGSR